MSVLNVFLIGTGHTQEEEFNLLVLLHDLVSAETIKTKANYEMDGDSFRASTLRGDVKVVFDGPGFTDLPLQAGPKMTTVRDEVRRLAEQMKTVQGANVETVNLFGHSRGAITAIYTANELADKNLINSCNLFLVDPVKRARIPDDKANILPEITKDCIVLAMEDEAFFGSIKPPGMTGNIFKLEKLTRADEGEIKYIRLPGTHGTATQCNPVTDSGEDVKTVQGALPPRSDLTAEQRTRNARALLKKPIWPIGGFALRRGLWQLMEWGARLDVRSDLDTASANTLSDIKAQLFHGFMRDYFAIANKNPFHAGKSFSSGAKYERLVNDTAKSTAGKRQKYSYKHGYRTDDFLEKEVGVPPNPWRYTPLFLNTDHVQLFKTTFESQFPDLVGILTEERPDSVGKRRLFIGGEDVADRDIALTELKQELTSFMRAAPELRTFVGQAALNILNT